MSETIDCNGHPSFGLILIQRQKRQNKKTKARATNILELEQLRFLALDCHFHCSWGARNALEGKKQQQEKKNNVKHKNRNTSGGKLRFFWEGETNTIKSA